MGHTLLLPRLGSTSKHDGRASSRIPVDGCSIQRRTGCPCSTWTLVIAGQKLWAVINAHCGDAFEHSCLSGKDEPRRNHLAPARWEMPNDPSDQYLKKDCYAHSSVMNLANNAIRPLMILTDAQCSAGQFIAVGTLQQVGGKLQWHPRCQHTHTVSSSWHMRLGRSTCVFVAIKLNHNANQVLKTYPALPGGPATTPPAARQRRSVHDALVLAGAVNQRIPCRAAWIRLT